jgi:hypothetical protein
MSPRPLPLALPLALLGACGGNPSTDAGADAAAPTRARVFVSSNTERYDNGSLATVARDTLAAGTNLAPLSGDAVLFWHGRTLVALNFGQGQGTTQDNLTFFDVSGDAPRLLAQVSSKLDDEPRDSSGDPRGYLALDDHRAYVTRLSKPRLLLVDPATGATTAGPDLAPYAGGAALPNPRAIALVQGRAWVMLERLSDDLANPTTLGAVAVIDPATGGVDRVIDLPHADPVGKFAVRGSRVLLACVGSYQAVGNGGVEQIDADSFAVQTVVSETDVDGNIDAVAALDDDRLVLRLLPQAHDGLQLDQTTIAVYSLAARTLAPLVTVPLYRLTEPLVGSDGRVYVGDRGDPQGARPAGVRVFDPNTGAEVTQMPVPVGLLPYDLTDEPGP